MSQGCPQLSEQLDSGVSICRWRVFLCVCVVLFLCQSLGRQEPAPFRVCVCVLLPTQLGSFDWHFERRGVWKKKANAMLHTC